MLSTTERRLAAALAVAAALTLFIAVAAVSAPRHASDAVTLAYWQDSGHRAGDVVSTYALLVCGPCFAAFVTVLLSHQMHSAAAMLAGRSAVLFAAMTFVTGAMGALTRGAVVDGEPLPGAELTRILLQLRYTAMGAFAMPCAAVAIACASALAFKGAVLSRALGWIGVVCSLGILAAAATYRGQFAIPALLLWLVACAVAVLRNPRPAQVDVRPAPAVAER